MLVVLTSLSSPYRTSRAGSYCAFVHYVCMYGALHVTLLMHSNYVSGLLNVYSHLDYLLIPSPIPLHILSLTPHSLSSSPPFISSPHLPPLTPSPHLPLPSHHSESYSQLFAYQYKPKHGEMVKRSSGWALYDSASEYHRMGVPNKYWKDTTINANFEVHKCVPTGITVAPFFILPPPLFPLPPPPPPPPPPAV